MVGGKKILLIDDEIDLGEILVEMLQPHYEVAEFISDSRIAKQILTEQNYDLVISDVLMPGLEGSDLI
jgi:DNA-binding response OmpR family regulator